MAWIMTKLKFDFCHVPKCVLNVIMALKQTSHSLEHDTILNNWVSIVSWFIYSYILVFINSYLYVFLYLYILCYCIIVGDDLFILLIHQVKYITIITDTNILLTIAQWNIDYYCRIILSLSHEYKYDISVLKLSNGT